VSFAENLRRLMDDQGMNQVGIAAACNVNKATVSRWLHEGRTPGRETLPTLAEALHCAPEELTDEPPKPPIDLGKRTYTAKEAAALMEISVGELTQIIQQGNARPWGTGHVQKSGKFKPYIFARPLNKLLGITPARDTTTGA